jgi:hypothetical protein
MTESQVALYGGAWWVGPVFLTGYLLLYWWLDNGPITEWGRRRSERRAARSAAEWRRLREQWERTERQETRSPEDRTGS